MSHCLTLSSDSVPTKEYIWCMAPKNKNKIYNILETKREFKPNSPNSPSKLSLYDHPRRKSMMGYGHVTGLVFSGAGLPKSKGQYSMILLLGSMI